LLGKRCTAAALRDALDLFDNKLAQSALSWPDSQLEGTVINDLQCDFSAESSMDHRRRDVRGQAETGLLASAPDACGELALDWKSYVLQGSHENERSGRNNHGTIRVDGQGIGKIDDFRKIDVIDVDRVGGSSGA
jgi:hypothetical protein